MCTFTGGQLRLGPPAGAAWSSRGGGEGGAGAAGPRDGERDGCDGGRVQLVRGQRSKCSTRFVHDVKLSTYTCRVE